MTTFLFKQRRFSNSQPAQNVSENVAAAILAASEGGILPPVFGQNAAGSRLHWQAGKLCRHI
jgi:hypothetical protein